MQQPHREPHSEKYQEESEGVILRESRLKAFPVLVLFAVLGWALRTHHPFRLLSFCLQNGNAFPACILPS